MKPALYVVKTPLRAAYLQIANRMSRRTFRDSLLSKYGINLVLDVGANNGQYARRLISSGFDGRIVSFEPLPTAFEKLEINQRCYPGWQAVPWALGRETKTATLHVAGNSQSSSMLPMCDRHVQAAPQSAYVADVTIKVKSLDEVFDQFCDAEDRVLLKMDVQGLEHDVLDGATECLDRIAAVQMELSLQALYEGGPTWDESIVKMRSLGFVPAKIQGGFADQRTGLTLQADGLFIRQDVVDSLTETVSLGAENTQSEDAQAKGAAA